MLSQWRGYSGSSGGICLGFRSAKLVSSAASICGRIAPCIYDQRKQHELVDEMLNVSFNDLSSEFRPSQETSRAAAEVFVRQLVSCVALFKDIGFREEAEWRLITAVGENPSVYEYGLGNL